MVWREIAATGAESAALLARVRGVNILVLVERYAFLDGLYLRPHVAEEML